MRNSLFRVIKRTGGAVSAMILVFFSSGIVKGSGSAPAAPPVFVRQWGGQGGGHGLFEFDEAVAVDSTGNVYVADAGNDLVQKFDSNGDFITQWGGPGFGGHGLFASPTGLAVNSASGVVYVADDASLIQKFDTQGNFISQWGGPDLGSHTPGLFAHPRGVAVDSFGNVYVADLGTSFVQKFDADGNFITRWGGFGFSEHGLFRGAIGIGVDPMGHVYVSDFGGVVQKFDSNGTFITQWGGLGVGNGLSVAPVGLAVDPASNVYVIDDDLNLAQKFDSNGNFITQWRGGFDGPGGIAADASGNIYVADTSNNLIKKFSSVNACFRDNQTGDVIQFSTITGAYSFTRCSTGQTISGSGSIRLAGGVVTITDFRSDRRVRISFSPNQLTGRAVVTFAIGSGVWQTFVINDANPMGSACSTCQG